LIFIYFCVLKIFLKKFKYFYFFYFKLIFLLLFLNYFNILISKIIFKNKKYYFNKFSNKLQPHLQFQSGTGFFLHFLSMSVWNFAGDRGL